MTDSSEGNWSTNRQGERLFGLDIIKAIAILVVVALHSDLCQIDFIGQPSIARFAQYALRLL